MLKKSYHFFIESKPVTFLDLILFLFWGIVSSPFSWNTRFLPNDFVSVDAIPDNIYNAELIISDGRGRIINKCRIDRSFSDLKINIISIRHGTYFYWIEAIGYKSESMKFIVN
jgi:hypothetical protein